MFGWRQALLRQIPSVESLLERPEVKEWLAVYPRPLVVEAVREALEDTRSEVVAMDEPMDKLDIELLISRTAYLVETKARSSLKPVINATGIVLHTNLGRALLSRKAVEAVQAVASRFSNLEVDLESGMRGSRFTHVEGLLQRLTGAEDSMVVNNNAGAVLLALSSMASGKEVIVSRGELVEIGGSFRVPDVMEQSGARLVEVGTTNRTYPDDYSRAVTGDTALLLKVHTSNYRVMGFASSTSTRELVKAGADTKTPVMEDLGSGSILDLEAFGIKGEPSVRAAVKDGVDVITFSGDKLLGGPQAGIIVGKSKYISPMKKHPLARALRIDKMTAAALEATLREYLADGPEERVPVSKMLMLSDTELSERAEDLQYKLQAFGGLEAEVVKGTSQAGGGSLPLLDLLTFLVGIKVPGIPASELAEDLRRGAPPVMAIIRDEKVFFDVRTISPEENAAIAACVSRAISP